MLVLTRKIGEKITIGDNVTITVIDIDHRFGKARIGIQAPKDVSIWRSELLPAAEEKPAAK